MAIEIRKMARDDLSLGLRLSRQAGWNQTEADWLRLMSFVPDGCFVAELILRQLKSALRRRRAQRCLERLLHLRHWDAVLRSFRAGERRLNRAHVKFNDVGKFRNRRIVRAEQALLFHVAFDELHLLFIAAGVAHVIQALIIHGEKAHRGAVFRAHVGDRSAIGQAHF